MKTDKTNTDKTDKKAEFLFPDLTFKLRGIFFNVANQYGLGHREKVYHQALIDLFQEADISFEHERQIPIYSYRDGRKIGTYIPDFLIKGKIILEVKSDPFLLKQFVNQIYSYLRVTDYELAFVVNFGEEELRIKRILFTNDRKSAYKL